MNVDAIPLMKAFAHSIEIDPRVISPPTMNYGQHQRFSTADRREYRYEMSVGEFRAKIDDCFAKFRQGEIADTYDEGDATEFPQLFDWRSRRFPDLDSLLNNDRELLIELIKYWEYDISHAVTEFTGPEPSEWIVMSIDDVIMSLDSVVVIGAAYERPTIA